MAKIAELFGQRCIVPHDSPPRAFLDRYCPFTKRTCDVTANRSDRAELNLHQSSVSEADRLNLEAQYGVAPIPLGICSIMTTRQNEESGRPWIVCPKRLMELKANPPTLPEEVRRLIPIAAGTKVRCWWEFKFRSRASIDPDAALDEAMATENGEGEGALAAIQAPANRFFEYTFDYIIIPVEQTEDAAHPTLIGPPYILEVMTSSTRGGGLTEHMVDVLSLRDQATLRGRVKSPYTPNYRQVFERMLGQFFAKAEAAEAWGGRAIWLVQDVLIDYIEQSTDFRAADYPDTNTGNVYVSVFRMHDEGESYSLRYDRTLRGNSRNPTKNKPDFTTMLGLGHAPPLQALLEVLSRTQTRTTRSTAPNWIDFVW